MLTNISISNFKSLEDESLDLKPLTILTGTNSSGKSSVIQAIMLVLKYSSTPNMYSMEELTRYLNNFSAIRNKKVNAKEIKISIIDDTKTSEVVITPDVISGSGFMEYVYEPIGDNDKKELLYLNANRMGAQEQVAVTERRVGNAGEFLFSTFDKIKSLPLSDCLVKFPDSKTIAYQLAEWMSFISGTDSELITENSGEKIKVSFKIKDLEGSVSPFNLGAGMSYLSKVLIICLMAKKGDLILIENPEVQLHPKAQAQLGVFLTHIAKSGVQLIVETHCEHLINKIAYQVYDEAYLKQDLIIHYKPSVDDNFISLRVDETGRYTDLNNKPAVFPKGFFDATLDDLRSMQ
ncbi:AAA family ATPase [Pectobacterium aroidearum]|uniref:AAA family ATPase n=1 Tax=Pectobacterium aroidearum TaxID=1201031 RepID=UPI002A82A437|nr:AAA family ATPase [Pectobacterium aroidearum]MDY4388100.1 AAA family ATPase [Pectobacterium aroidearum]